jgi:dTDP-4-dehydrorhamnose 3,5-epimerase
VIFHSTPIAGAYWLEPERHVDERGSFSRLYCAREFADHGLDPRLAQASLSTNARRGTLRGMHYSVPPHAEAKVVRCVRGAVHDVLLDLRVGSPSYLESFGRLLTAKDANALYVPEGVAHGFLTLEDESDVLYQMTEFYDPASARGVRWNDAAFRIRWPEEPVVVSDRDRTYPDFAGPVVR